MATMQDVAERAGVSIATVSFVVNGTKRVAPHTQAKVEAAMRELGYARNHAASALARGRTDILALLSPALERNLSGTAMEFITRAAERALQRGYKLVLWPFDNQASSVQSLIASRLVAGAILMEVDLHDARVPALRESGLPFSLIGRTLDPAGMAWVDVDFDASIVGTMKDLLGLGHRRIAYVDFVLGGDPEGNVFAGAMRARAAYVATMKSVGASPVLLRCPETPWDGRRLAARLLSDHPDVTALVVMNEHAAPGIVMGLAAAGVRVPEDLSIISVGTTPMMAAFTDPVLTHTVSPARELSRLGVDAVIDRINDPGQPLPQILLPCMRASGESVAPPRS